MKKSLKRRRRVQRKNKTPSVRGILSQDYFAMVGFLLATILSLVCIVSLTMAGDLNPALVKMAPWIIVIGYVTAYQRVSKVQQVFKDGEYVSGNLISKYYHENGVNLEYTYKYKDRSYHRKYYAAGSRYLKTLDTGDETDIIIDPNFPDEGLMVGIFSP